MKVSVIIRTLNELWGLKKIHKILKEQKFSGEIEVIISDNESVDGTREFAKEIGAIIATTPRDEFSFPKALNAGAEVATGDYLAFLVGHSFPVRKDWLCSMIEVFSDAQVAGVFAPPVPDRRAGWIEYWIYIPLYLYCRFIMGTKAINDIEFPAIMNANGCAIPRKLWEEHPFDERYGAGAEDKAWAKWALDQGYKIICDWRFAVYHSHGLTKAEWKKQQNYWDNHIGLDQSYDVKKLQEYRKDLDFSK